MGHSSKLKSTFRHVSISSHVFSVTISRSHRKKATLIHTFLSHHRSSSASDLLIFNLPWKKFATLSTLTVYRWFLDIVVVWNSRKLMCGAWTEKVYGIPNAEVGLTRKRIMTTRPPLPPLSRETAIQKVCLAEDGWGSVDLTTCRSRESHGLCRTRVQGNSVPARHRLLERRKIHDWYLGTQKSKAWAHSSSRMI